MNKFDLFYYHLLNNFAGHNPFFDAFFSFIAQYALEIYALLFIAIWLTLPKKQGKQRHALIVMVFTGVLALLINLLISHIWFRSRPFVMLSKGQFTQLIPHSVDASFPSDHASGSFGFAAASWGKSPKWISYCFTIFAVLVGLSRIYCGVHWPTDIIASLLVGVLSSKVVWRFNYLLNPVTYLGLKLFHYGKFSKPKARLQ